MGASMTGPQTIKQRDLQPCRLCGHGVMHSGDIAFHRVTIERFVVHVAAVKRQHGLEMMLGPVAAHMGPDEDLARTHPDLCQTALICQPCAIALQLSVFQLAERLAAGLPARVAGARATGCADAGSEDPAGA